MRPHVSINMAMTADGKIASANRRASSFGSRADHARLMALRDRADAILTGAGTLNAQPEINLAVGPRSSSSPPLRIIASGSGRVNPRHKVFRTKGAPVLVLTADRISLTRLKKLKSAAHTVKVCGVNEINFADALEWLRGKWGVKRLLCEGGGHLNDSLFRAGLVDEVNLTVCPLLLGGRDAPTISDGLGFDELANATHFTLKTREQVGDELFLTYWKA